MHPLYTIAQMRFTMRSLQCGYSVIEPRHGAPIGGRSSGPASMI